jgi:peptidoglycan/LPS O-acetylase OafA/YrhL
VSARKRIPSLDGLRAVSILFVILAHLTETAGFPHTPVTAFAGRFGRFGVQVFFVISGYLITTLLLAEHSKNGCISLRLFYRRRAYRIMPASLFTTTLIVATMNALGIRLGRSYILASYTFSLGYLRHIPWQLGHLWSLGAEEQFYLVWPLGLALFFAHRTWVAWGMMLAAPLARLALVHYTDRSLDYAFPAVADSMAAGCLVALYIPELDRLPVWFHSLPSVLILVSMAMFGSTRIQEHSVLYWGLEPMVIALAMYVLVRREDWVLNNRSIMYVGSLSFALYLVQQPFLCAKMHSPVTAFPLNIICAVFAAVALHYVIERPILLLGQRRATFKAAPVLAMAD